MKYACLVYHDASLVADLTEEEQLTAILAECKAAAAWMAELKKRGHHVFTAGLQNAHTATTVRTRNGKIAMTNGPFAETKELLGGITIIEARGLNEALQLVSEFASNLLTIEVRPILDANAVLADPLDQKIVAALKGPNP